VARLRSYPGILAALALAAACGCGQPPSTETVLFTSSLESLDSVITRTGVSVDEAIRTEGAGSLRVDAAAPTVIRIAEVQPENAEDAVLLYRARLRTRDLSGKAYLEMWCRIPGKGEFFSRGLHSPLTGTSDWASQETLFLLEEGQRADLVKLNLVVDGVGTVWIDDAQLSLGSR